MPELPEVQVVVDDLNAAGLVGRRIDSIVVYWTGLIQGLAPRIFINRVKGRCIGAVHRRGKYILFALDDGSTMAVHLRMSGRFILIQGRLRRPRHVHLALGLDDDRRLWFYDPRKFGRFYHDPKESNICGHLGIEPLAPDFNHKKLGVLLYQHRRQIKPLLLDQTMVAGLGNIYVDEALWAAGIHPLRASGTLSWAEIRRLHTAVRRVLRQGIKHSGTSLGRGQGNFASISPGASNSSQTEGKRGANAVNLKVYRRTGQPCPRCREAIQRIVVGQRGTHICSHCQPLQPK